MKVIICFDILILPLLLWILPCQTFAQEHRVFKEGDRVLASPMSLRDDKYWRPCKVTEVHNFVPKRAYSLICDPQTAGGPTSSFLVNEDWIKPAPAGDERGAADDPGSQAPQEMSGQIACPASDPGLGSGALDNSFRAAILQGSEREPAPGNDGRVTVTIQSLKVGASHPYRVYEDPNEARGKTIYEVRSIFTSCTDYQRRIVLVRRERAFSCYKNTAGEMVCDIHAAANTNIKDETKSIDKPAR